MSIEKFTGTFAKEDGGVTIMVNETIQSIRNPKTLAVYAYLLSKPSTWIINTEEIKRHFDMGRDVVRRSLNELIELRLLSRHVAKTGNLNSGFHYILHLKPHAQLDDSRETDFQGPENQSPYKTKIYKQNKDSNIITDDEIVKIYHAELPENPGIKVVDWKLSKQLQKMRRDWPKYSSSGQSFSLEAFREFLIGLKTYQPGFLKPYQSESGRTIQNNLRNITRETNLAKIVNGEFNFK
jgi:predicted DNA-binding transcriptional regulator